MTEVDRLKILVVDYVKRNHEGFLSGLRKNRLDVVVYESFEEVFKCNDLIDNYNGLIIHLSVRDILDYGSEVLNISKNKPVVSLMRCINVEECLEDCSAIRSYSISDCENIVTYFHECCKAKTGLQ